MIKTARLLIGLVATPAIATLLLVPTARAHVADSPSDAASSGLSVTVERDVSASGIYDSWTITHHHDGDAIGSATFYAYGEHLEACDQEWDGDTVRAGLELDYGIGSGWAVDSNGYGGSCGENNLTTNENVPATLYVCVDGHGCWSTRVHT